ncbi:MAG: glycosyltransferase [Bacteroidia bacterium]|nr:glycosyltransferase [Bacteroidia bacterium]MCF8425902.1 glycosyltransferase [Bacteroidia bacterium]MCF8446157.1 glycosyltransferase [Bacteroidia bacterium]
MFEIILILLLWLFICLQLFVLAAVLADRPLTQSLKEFPQVVVLVPARNEENNILECLQSLVQLNYPKEAIQIWVGDDNSTDNTAQIIQHFASKNSGVHYYKVDSNLGSARAKGNVLEHLVQATEANYIFVTDADIKVSPNWVRQLLPKLISQECGIVSGTTLVQGNTLFKTWQGIDWTIGNGNLIGLDRLGIKSTAIGNNMAFTRNAYSKTGGYSKMKFSVTEDFQLFKAIRQAGFGSYNLLDAASLNISKAQETIKNLLHQRKRWMIGARDLPWFWLLIFGLQASFYPVIFIVFGLNQNLAITIYLTKVILQTSFVLLIHVRLKRGIPWLGLVSYEFYSIFIHVLMIAFYFIPIKMNWKERTY